MSTRAVHILQPLPLKNLSVDQARDDRLPSSLTATPSISIEYLEHPVREKKHGGMSVPKMGTYHPRNPRGEWRQRLLQGMFRKRHGQPDKGKNGKGTAFFRLKSSPSLEQPEKQESYEFNRYEKRRRGTSLDGALEFNGYYLDPPHARISEDESLFSFEISRLGSSTLNGYAQHTAPDDTRQDEEHSSNENFDVEPGEQASEASKCGTPGTGDVILFNLQDLAALDDAEIVSRVTKAVKQFRARSENAVCSRSVDVPESRKYVVEDARLTNLSLVPSVQPEKRSDTPPFESQDKDPVVPNKLGVQGLVRMVAERQLAQGAILKSPVSRRLNHFAEPPHKGSSLFDSLRRTRSLSYVGEKPSLLRRLRSLHTLTRPHHALIGDRDTSKMSEKHMTKNSKPLRIFRRRDSAECNGTVRDARKDNLRGCGASDKHVARSKESREAHESQHQQRLSIYNVERKQDKLLKTEDRGGTTAAPHCGLWSDSSETSISSWQEFGDFGIRRTEKITPPKWKASRRLGLKTTVMSRLRRRFQFRR